MSITINCPVCDHPYSATKDVRKTRAGYVRRTKVCKQCRHVFSTKEILRIDERVPSVRVFM